MFNVMIRMRTQNDVRWIRDENWMVRQEIGIQGNVLRLLLSQFDFDDHMKPHMK